MRDAEFTLAPNALIRILNAAGGLLEEHYRFAVRKGRDGNAKLLRLTALEVA